MTKKIQVTLVKSLTKCTEKQKACAFGLGLRKIRQSRILLDTPSNRGMTKKIHFLVKIGVIHEA